MMARDGTAEAFWRFSLMVYARAGVADALNGLQERGGHNVSLILFGVWIAICRGSRLDAETLAHARAATAPLDREIVQPLRRLRRALKKQTEADMPDLRRRVLALELAAERRAQARLAATAARCRDGAADRGALVEANLRLILGDDGSSPEATALRGAVADTFFAA